jgi:hypothetical protein
MFEKNQNRMLITNKCVTGNLYDAEQMSSLCNMASVSANITVQNHLSSQNKDDDELFDL